METVVQTMIDGVKTSYGLLQKLGWKELHRITLDIGGLILLVLSLYGASCLKWGLRIPAMLIGLVALVDVLTIIEVEFDLGDSKEGMTASRFSGVGEDPQDKILRKGYQNRGRVYMEPRVPRVSGLGTDTIEVRGSPGGKVVYWPSGGSGLGASNDRLRIDKERDPLAIRDSAMGCGVVMLDERGRGVAMAERGCSHLLYREVTNSGQGGPLGKIRVGYDSNDLISDGRGERSRKNAMGGMRPAGTM